MTFTFTITAHDVWVALGVVAGVGVAGSIGFVWASLRFAGGFGR